MKNISELNIGKYNFERLLLVDINGSIEFGTLIDGMIMIDAKNYPLTDFKSFCTIKELKNKLEII